jgi:hypothetical protein
LAISANLSAFVLALTLDLLGWVAVDFFAFAIAGGFFVCVA